MFSTEMEMIDATRHTLGDIFAESGAFALFEEVEGLFGIPDVVIVGKKIISIEFKLSNWKRAMQQAFKYRKFSNESYVILDEPYIKRAYKNIDMFKRGNIGLGYVDQSGSINICFKPTTLEPFSEVMYNKLLAMQ